MRSTPQYTVTVTVTALIMMIASVYIGFRDIWVGADTGAYVKAYLETQSCNCLGNREIGFEIYSLILAQSGFSSEIFLSSISLITFALLAIFAHKISTNLLENGLLSRKSQAALFLFIIGIILMSPMMVSSQYNGLRQGVSSFSLAIFVFEVFRRNRFSALIFALIAIAFHNSAVLYIACVLAFSFALKWLTPVRVSVIMLSLLGLYGSGASQKIIQIIAPSVYAFVNDYGQSASDRLQTGIRWDYALFTLAMTILGYILLRISDKKIFPIYWRYFVLVTSSSVPFFILGWGYFSNRYLFTTWILLAVLIGTMMGTVLARKQLISAAAMLMVIMGPTAFYLQIDQEESR